MTGPTLTPWPAGAPPSAAERLESGEILTWDPARFAPLPEDDLVFLREVSAGLKSGRNISYHPRGGFTTGLSGPAADRRRTERILADYQRAAAAHLAALLPGYAAGWRAGKANYRPEQEAGRALSVRGSNERLHVDAFASGPTFGARVLRFFTNAHPSEPRVWKSAGLLPALLERFGAAALGDGAPALNPGALEAAGIAALSGLTAAGVAPLQLVGSSPYDRAMRRLHNHLKEDDAFQSDADAQTQLAFAPGQSWAVMTDLVSHAVVRGQHALVATFYVDLDRCALPDRSPWRLLESM